MVSLLLYLPFKIGNQMKDRTEELMMRLAAIVRLQ